MTGRPCSTRSPAVFAALAAGLLAAACATAPRPAGGPPPPRPPPASSSAPSPGGVPTVSLPAPGRPTVDLQLRFLSGSVDDPAGREGLTRLAATVMVEGGTQALDAAALQRALYPMGAELGVVVGRETVTFTGRCPAAALDRFLPIFLDVVRRPRFDPREVERLRARAQDGVEKGLRSEDDERLAREALQTVLYAGHPYGHPTLGTVQGLSKVTPDELRTHARAVFVRSRLTVGVAGGVPGDLADRIAGELRQLPQGAPRGPLPPPRGEGPRVTLVEKHGTPTPIALGLAWDVRRGDPDFPALVLAVSALGEHRQGAAFRLFRAFREARGLNYGAYAYSEHFVQSGDSALAEPGHPRTYGEFTVQLRPVEPEARLFALRTALFEVERWAKDGLTQDELDRVRAFLLGYTLTFSQTDARRLGQALDDRFYGLDRPWLVTLRERLRKLSLADVNGALRRHVDPARLRIVIATHGAEAFADELRAGKPSPMTYTVGRPAAVKAEDDLIASLPLGVTRPEDVRVVKASDLFER